MAHIGDHYRRAFYLRRRVESVGPGSLRRGHRELSHPSLGSERAAGLLSALAGNDLRACLDLSAFVFRRSCALCFALLLVFIGASIAAKARGIDISCGCFGHVSDQLAFAWHLVLDFAIFATVIALWRWDGAPPAQQSEPVVRLSSRGADFGTQVNRDDCNYEVPRRLCGSG